MWRNLDTTREVSEVAASHPLHAVLHRPAQTLATAGRERDACREPPPEELSWAVEVGSASELGSA